MSKPVIRVVAALIYDDHNHILITQRTHDSHLGGYWEFPGGRIENKELPEEALVREIEEEVGLAIKVKQEYWREKVEYESRIIDIRFYLCTMVPAIQRVSLLEVADFKWVLPKELSSFNFPKADQRLILQLQKIESHPLHQAST